MIEMLADVRGLGGSVGEQIILLVSDPGMPDMSGLDLRSMAKQRRTFAIGCGEDEFLATPADVAELKLDSTTVMVEPRGNG